MRSRHGHTSRPDPAHGRTHGTINEQGLRSLLDGLKVGIAYLHSKGKILYCNPTFANLVGRRAGRDIIGQNLKNVVSLPGWTPIAEALQTAAYAPVDGELCIDSREGTRYLTLSLGPLHDSPIPTAQIFASVIETTDVVQANAAVNDRDKSLRSLAARILEVQDQHAAALLAISMTSPGRK